MKKITGLNDKCLAERSNEVKKGENRKHEIEKLLMPNTAFLMY